MKIAVCDDELTVREQVSDIIKTYFDERKRNVELTLYESGRKMIEDLSLIHILYSVSPILEAPLAGDKV